MDSNLSETFSNRLGHAQSTPAGVDGSGMSTSKTPPITPKRSGKMLAVRVQMLDDSITVFHVQVRYLGSILHQIDLIILLTMCTMCSIVLAFLYLTLYQFYNFFVFELGITGFRVNKVEIICYLLILPI